MLDNEEEKVWIEDTRGSWLHWADRLLGCGRELCRSSIHPVVLCTMIKTESFLGVSHGGMVVQYFTNMIDPIHFSSHPSRPRAAHEPFITSVWASNSINQRPMFIGNQWNRCNLMSVSSVWTCLSPSIHDPFGRNSFCSVVSGSCLRRRVTVRLTPRRWQ